MVAGGVACNKVLRERMAQLTPKGVKLRIAKPINCTDNAAMVAGIGYHHFINKEFSELNFDAYARLPQIVKVPFIK